MKYYSTSGIVTAVEQMRPLPFLNGSPRKLILDERVYEMRLQRRNHPSCPIDLVVHIIGNKWAVPILRDLFTGPKRPSSLLKSLKGISPKTLTDRLREMEESGLVTRTVYATVPPCVEYSLTPMGNDLRDLMLVLKELGTKWGQALQPEKCPNQQEDICSHCLIDQNPFPCPIASASLKTADGGNKRVKVRKASNR